MCVKIVCLSIVLLTDHIDQKDQFQVSTNRASASSGSLESLPIYQTQIIYIHTFAVRTEPHISPWNQKFIILFVFGSYHSITLITGNFLCILFDKRFVLVSMEVMKISYFSFSSSNITAKSSTAKFCIESK